MSAFASFVWYKRHGRRPKRFYHTSLTCVAKKRFVPNMENYQNFINPPYDEASVKECRPWQIRETWTAWLTAFFNDLGITTVEAAAYLEGTEMKERHNDEWLTYELYTFEGSNENRLNGVNVGQRVNDFWNEELQRLPADHRNDIRDKRLGHYAANNIGASSRSLARFKNRVARAIGTIRAGHHKSGRRQLYAAIQCFMDAKDEFAHAYIAFHAVLDDTKLRQI